MKYCTHCGTQLATEAKFCQSCGRAAGSDTQAVGVETHDSKKGSSQDVHEEKKGFFVSLYAPIFHERDLNKLMQLFLYVSVFDVVLSFVFRLMHVIPDHSAVQLSPVGYLIGDSAIAVIFYLILRYWGVSKKARLPVVFCIAITALLLGFAWTESHIQAFAAYLHTGPKFPEGALAFYEHFLSGLLVEGLIMIRILVLLNDRPTQQ